MLARIWKWFRASFSGNDLSDYGKKNRIESAAKTFRSCKIQIFGNNNLLRFEEGVVATNLEITIIGSNNIIQLKKGVSYLRGSIWLSSNHGNITVGEDTTISEASLTITEPNLSITLGRDCQLAWGVDIRVGDGHPIVDIITGKKVNTAASVYIEDHVWIATHVLVLKGVTIGSNSVIGARTVVTKYVPPNAIAVGTPSKLVRQNITWHRENRTDLPLEN